MNVTPEVIADAVMVAMQRERAKESRERIGSEMHSSHHAFIQILMERETRAVERRKKFEGSFIGGVALAILGLLGWLGNLIMEALKMRFHE